MASLTTGSYSKSKLDESNFINVVSLANFQKFQIHFAMKIMVSLYMSQGNRSNEFWTI